MKKILIVIFILLVAAIGYLLIADKEKVKEPTAIYQTFSSSMLGFEFKYRTQPKGYSLIEQNPKEVSNDPNLLKTLVLMQKTDEANLKNNGEFGEGPATITIHILKNPNKRWPEVWAMENKEFSNLNLIIGSSTETAIGGAKASRYFADGLYRSENVVITNGENVYLVSGMYLEEDSDLRRDFQPLLDSIKFIPQ